VAVPANVAVVYATLTTQVGGVWQPAQSYAYAVNPNPNTAPLVLSGTQVAAVPNNMQKVRRVYYFSSGDPRSIGSVSTSATGLTATLVSVTAPTSTASGTATIEFQANSSVTTGVVATVTAVSSGGVQLGQLRAAVAVCMSSIDVSPKSGNVGDMFEISGPADLSTIDYLEICDPEGGCQRYYDYSGLQDYWPKIAGNYAATLYVWDDEELPTDETLADEESPVPAGFVMFSASPKASVTLDPAKIVTGVGTQFTLTAEVDGSGSYSYGWSIDNTSVVSLPQGNCAKQTTCTFTAGAEGGRAAVTFTVIDSSGNATPTKVPVTVVEITLTSIAWTQQGVMYKQSATQPWLNDTLATEGTVLVGWVPDSKDPTKLDPVPVWTCCNASDGPTLTDPVVYQAGGNANMGPLTFNIYPQLANDDLKALQGAALQITSNNALLAFDSPGLALTTLDSDGNYSYPYGITSTSQMPGSMANFDAELTFSISWVGGGQSTIGTAAQTFFVTLGTPAAFAGGSFTSTYFTYRYLASGVTAQRVNYVTQNLAGNTASSLMTALKGYLVNGSGPKFTLGSNSVDDAWAALDNPTQYPLIDCSSLAWIAAVLLEHAGVNAGFSYAFATTNNDATALKQSSESNGLPMLLEWYLSQGIQQPAQKYEAYVYLCQGAVASEAHTLDPVVGPIYPLGAALPAAAQLPADACPTAGVGTMQGLALAVIARILQGQQTNPTDTTYGGLQWWVDPASKGPVSAASGGGKVPFPFPGLGVK
jgi:hypothetical protein